jgi:hypothetical protein
MQHPCILSATRPNGLERSEYEKDKIQYQTDLNSGLVVRSEKAHKKKHDEKPEGKEEPDHKRQSCRCRNGRFSQFR